MCRALANCLNIRRCFERLPRVSVNLPIFIKLKPGTLFFVFDRIYQWIFTYGSYLAEENKCFFINNWTGNINEKYCSYMLYYKFCDAICLKTGVNFQEYYKAIVCWFVDLALIYRCVLIFVGKFTELSRNRYFVLTLLLKHSPVCAYQSFTST